MDNYTCGGPAFPRPDTVIGEKLYEDGCEGMSMRDYFAAHAPITWGDAYSQSGVRRGVMTAAERQTLNELWALLRYEYADAMLAQRGPDKEE